MDEEIIGILFTLATNAVLYAIGLSIYSCVKKSKEKKISSPKESKQDPLLNPFPSKPNKFYCLLLFPCAEEYDGASFLNPAPGEESSLLPLLRRGLSIDPVIINPASFIAPSFLGPSVLYGD